MPEIPPAAVNDAIFIRGEEAHHGARVKRLRTGEEVQVVDGLGTRLAGVVRTTSKTRSGEWEIAIDVRSMRVEPEPGFHVDVWSACPKGDRLEAMIDGLGQVGVRAWSPLAVDRGVVDPRKGKLERLSRVTIETMKQCGRSRVLTIGEPRAWDDVRAWRVGSEASDVLFADASGEEYQPMPARHALLLVGPEGGWSEAEREKARAIGARPVRLGVHTMRTEVAAVVGAGLVLHALALGAKNGAPRAGL